jgi:hypothetical protein
MSKFMAIAGILAAAAGVALGLMGYLSPGPLQAIGLTQEVAAILLMGGLGLIGLGGAIGAVDHLIDATRDLRRSLAGYDQQDARAEYAPAQATVAAAVEETAEDAKETAKETASAVKTSTADTIAALDKAKDDISKALGVTGDAPVAIASPSPAPPPPVITAPAEKPTETAEPPVVEAEATEVDEEQLFVVDEKVIRGRPARVLSDGTVEAETDEGWMRFENLEHLEEYIDAVSPPAKA